MNSEPKLADNPAVRLADVRVLILFGGERFFGSERANLEVFRCLSESGLQVRFITSSKWGGREIEPALDELGFGWVRAPYGYHWGRYLLGWKFYYLFANLFGLMLTSWRVWREARSWRATHLYVGNWEYASYALPAFLWLGLPVIFRAGDELPVHTCFHRWITGRLVRCVKRFICVSEFIRKSCIAAGVMPGQAQVIYSYPAARTQRGQISLPQFPVEATVIAYVGQIAEHKGVDLLIDAVEQLLRRGRNIVLVFAGEPSWGSEQLEQLKRRVEAAALQSRIFFLGYVADAFVVMERCDIHVCPSRFDEPLANVVMEAKLCSRPSVVFPSGGLPEVIRHQVDGFICRDRSREALEEGVEFFLTDPVRRKVAGEAARQSLAERFGPERYRQEWSAVFSGHRD